MSLFENINPINDQIRAEKESEARQINFAREQNVYNNASVDDETYLRQEANKSDLIRWQQELNDEAIKLIYFLKGYRLTERGWEKTSERISNDTFINYVVMQCAPFLSRNMINSNFDENRILMNLRHTYNDLCDGMATNWSEFGIGKNTSKWDLIIRQVKNTLFASAFRAKQGWTKKIDSTMTKRIESFREEQEQEKNNRGLFSIFGRNG